MRHISLALIVSVAGCGSGESTDLTERVRVGDTLVVFSHAPVYAETIAVHKVMRWGQFTGDPNLLFSDIHAFTPTRDGGILAHDEGDGIRRFDSRGNAIGRIAGTGAGPAEVRYLRALAEDYDGTVAAYDIGNGRISVYEQGEVSTFRRPEGMPRYGGDAVFFAEDGSLWIAVSPAFPETGSITHPRPVFARVNEQGALQDTIFTPGRMATDCPETSSSMTRRGFWEDIRAPFLPKVKWAMAPDGSLLVGCPAKYEFEVIRPDGFVYRLGRSWEPIRIMDEHREFLDRWVGGMGDLPEERPAYVRLISSSEGRIWVRPTLPSQQVPLPDEAVRQFDVTHTWSESARGVFDVFSVEDGWLGTVALPPEARYSGFPTEPPVVIRGDSIWAVATDSMDVQYIVKYVVDWPGA